MATEQRRHQSSVMWLKRCRPLPSRLLHCCAKVTAGREGAGLACAAGDTKRSLQTSHRSTQTKRYSCNSGAAVQQSAGSVGGFNKKRVSLCALLDFGSAKKGGQVSASTTCNKKKVITKFHVQVDAAVHELHRSFLLIARRLWRRLLEFGAQDEKHAARLRFPTCRHKYNPVSAQCQLKNHQVPRAVTHSFPLSISCLFITCVTKNTHLKWWYCFLKDQSHLFLSFSFLFFSVNV